MDLEWSSAVRALRTWLVISLLSSVSWIVCETLGGLAFLAAGVRLWSYHMVPLFWRITSPVIWLVVFLVMGPFMLGFHRVEARRGWSGVRRALYRSLFLVTVGPIVEVIINQYFFKGLLGAALYTYEKLPTFEGSGSLLSPFYYFTLYIHYPMTAALLRREG